MHGASLGDSVDEMTTVRLTLLSLVRMIAFGGGLAACGHSGKMVVDTPIMPYKAPDISDITGIDEDDDAGSAAAAPKTPTGGATPSRK
jgi:hypothetical protein